MHPTLVLTHTTEATLLGVEWLPDTACEHCLLSTSERARGRGRRRLQGVLSVAPSSCKALLHSLPLAGLDTTHSQALREGDAGGCEVLGVSWTRDTLLFTLTTRLAMVVDQEEPQELGHLRKTGSGGATFAHNDLTFELVTCESIVLHYASGVKVRRSRALTALSRLPSSDAAAR
jgi:hypothetical protein